MKTTLVILMVGLAAACGQGTVTVGGRAGDTDQAADANTRSVTQQSTTSTVGPDGWVFTTAVAQGQTVLGLAKGPASINGTVVTAPAGMTYLGVQVTLINRGSSACLDLPSEGIAFSVGGAVYDAEVGVPQMQTCIQPQERASGLLVFLVPDTTTIQAASAGSVLWGDGIIGMVAPARMNCFDSAAAAQSVCQVKGNQ